jgi:tRNA-specific 2-thiouridylase
LSLLRSADEFKDQTYFIYNIKTEQLPHVLFPIGGMKKPAVKKLAAKIGLPNANRKESMGLCFVGKVRLKEFLEQKVKARPGKIMLVPSAQSLVPSKTNRYYGLGTKDLPVIGQHAGLHTYTIGQRQGINVGGPGGPYYVLRKDLEKNILYVTSDPNDPALEVSEVQLHSVNWITELVPSAQYRVPSKTTENYALGTKHSLLARYRHQGELVPCTVEQAGKDLYTVKFKTPQKALASGQSVVFYKGKACLGGGVIV